MQNLNNDLTDANSSSSSISIDFQDNKNTQ